MNNINWETIKLVLDVIDGPCAICFGYWLGTKFIRWHQTRHSKSNKKHKHVDTTKTCEPSSYAEGYYSRAEGSDSRCNISNT